MSSRRATNVGREPPLDAMCRGRAQSDPVQQYNVDTPAVLPLTHVGGYFLM